MSLNSDDAYERSKARRKASKRKVEFSIFDEETTVEAYSQSKGNDSATKPASFASVSATSGAEVPPSGAMDNFNTDRLNAPPGCQDSLDSSLDSPLDNSLDSTNSNDDELTVAEKGSLDSQLSNENDSKGAGAELSISLDSSLGSSANPNQNSLDSSLGSPLDSSLDSLKNIELSNEGGPSEAASLVELDSHKIANKKAVSRLSNGLSNKAEVGASLDSSLDSDKKVKDSGLDRFKDSQKVADKIAGQVISDVIEYLPELRKKILLNLFERAIQAGGRRTGKLNSHAIAIECGTSYGSFKDAILNLRKKHSLISVEKSSRGNGGFTSYEINKDCFDHLVMLHKFGRVPLDSYKAADSLVHKTAHTHNLSSVKSGQFSAPGGREQLLNGGVFKFNIPDCLQKLNVASEQFTTIVSNRKLSFEVIQQSIEAFAYDIQAGKHKNTETGNPLSILFGVLRSGRPYVSTSYLEALKTDIAIVDAETKELYAEIERQRWLEKLASRYKVYKLSKEYDSTVQEFTKYDLGKNLSETELERLLWLDYQAKNPQNGSLNEELKNE